MKKECKTYFSIFRMFVSEKLVKKNHEEKEKITRCRNSIVSAIRLFRRNCFYLPFDN